MADKPTVVKVKIKLGDVEVEMSIEQVMELRKLLNDNFGPQEYYPYIPYVPPVSIKPWPYYPYWTTTTCGSSMTITGGEAT